MTPVLWAHIAVLCWLLGLRAGQWVWSDSNREFALKLAQRDVRRLSAMIEVVALGHATVREDERGTWTVATSDRTFTAMTVVDVARGFFP